jgi:HEAT repeat protein
MSRKKTVHEVNLLQDLSSTFMVRSWDAATEIGRHGDRKLLVPLIRQLKNGTKPFHRAASAYALGCIGHKHKPSISALEHTLADKNANPNVRGQAAEALAYLFANRAIPILIKCLTDPSKVVRFWSAFALGVAGTLDRRKAIRSLPALRELAKTDRRVVRGFWAVADEAEWAIAKLEQRHRDVANIERRCEVAVKSANSGRGARRTPGVAAKKAK